MVSTRILATFLSALPLSATAAPGAVDPGLAASLRTLAAQDFRVAAVAYRLQTAAAPHCPQQGRLSGLVVQDASQYRADWRPAVAEMLGLADLPAVVSSVVTGSPGDEAGVRPGDAIVAVNWTGAGGDPPAARDSRAKGGRFSALVDRLDVAFAAGPVTLSLRRNGRPLSIRLLGTPACPSIVQLDPAADR